MAASAKHVDKHCRGERYAMASSLVSQKPLVDKRGIRPEPSNFSGRKCADTVVRLSNGKSNNAEVCALSAPRTGTSGIIQSKSSRQFPGSPPVDTFIASGKVKTHAGPHLNTFSFNECAVRAPKPPLIRSESETAGRGGPPSDKASIRPVVSQPSISGYNRLKAANGYKVPAATLPHTKRKRRSKSVEEYTTPAQEILDCHSTNSLPRRVPKTTTSGSLKQADSLPSGFGDSINAQRDSASIHWFTDSSQEKEKTPRTKHAVSALPLSNKEILRNTSNQISLQQVGRRAECNNRPRCKELSLKDSTPAIVDMLDEGTSSRPASSSCSTEDGNVILEETEIDLELDKDEHELLVSSSSLPSSLSSPSPSSTLLPTLGSTGHESSNL